MELEDYKILKAQEELLAKKLAALKPTEVEKLDKQVAAEHVPAPKNAEEFKNLIAQMADDTIAFKTVSTWGKDKGSLVKGSWEGMVNYSHEQNTIVFPTFKMVHVKTHGGGSGDGEEYWAVVGIEVDGEIQNYYEYSGYYASYDGGYLDDGPYEVTPNTKTITVYNRKK